MLIVKKLKAKPYSSYEELQSYIESQVDYLQMRDETLNVGFSLRTLQRDIKEIRETFGVDIEYSKSNKGYFISQGEMENMNFQRMIESFDMFNSLNLARDLNPFILLEKRKPQGTENLYGLLHAVKNRLKVTFTYQKFWEDEASYRITDPYALKEFRNRWYLISKDNKEGKVKTFSLDRLTNLEITNKTFTLPKDYNAEESFRYSFGIISPDDQEPQEVVLSFDPVQGKYIKSLPLHESQEVLVDNEDELQIRLKLWITQDLVMELLSYGAEMKVLKPKSLIKEIKDAHQRAFNLYK